MQLSRRSFLAGVVAAPIIAPALTDPAHRLGVLWVDGVPQGGG